MANEIEMGRAEHHVNRIRSAFQNRGHGIDHDLDTFVRMISRESSVRPADYSVWRPREGNKEAVSRELLYGVSWVIVRQAFSMLRRKSSYLHAMSANATSATKTAVARKITSS
jgi:hypothetical protein